MLYLARFELRDGECSYTDLKVLQADGEDQAMSAAEDYLNHYFDEDTEILSDNWVEHKCGYPAVKLCEVGPISGLEALINRVGYIGEKPEISKIDGMSQAIVNKIERRRNRYCKDTHEWEIVNNLLRSVKQAIRYENPEVVIHVESGVADIESKPDGVRVIIRDYDSGECNEDCPPDCKEHQYSEFVAE